MPRIDEDLFTFKFPLNEGISPSGHDDKFLALQQASQNKIAALSQRKAQRDAAQAASRKSLIGQLGLDSKSIVGTGVNSAASLLSGASRVAGQLAALPSTVRSLNASKNITQEDIEAFNANEAGNPTREQLNRLFGRPDGRPSVLEQINEAKSLRDQSIGINETFDLTGLVEQTRRDELVRDIGKDFEENFAQLTDGLNNTEVTQGLTDVAESVGGLLSAAGSAVLDNPVAVTEFIIENIPQLALGLFGKGGQALMTSNNVGFATDIYQKGLAERTKANGGQLPSKDEQRTMAVQAVGIVLAEQLGDVVTLGAVKGATAGARLKQRTDLKQALTGTTSAVGRGALAEGPTEAIQTFLEGDILDQPATAKEVFTGGVIGAAVGGGLSGGGRGIGETAKLASQPSLPKPVKGEEPVDVAQTERTAKAIETEDITPLINPSNKATYAPDEAVRALFGISQKDGTTEEVKQNNLIKANEIIEDLNDQIQVNKSSLEGVTDIQLRIDSLEKSRTEATNQENITQIQELINALEEEKTSIESNPLSASERVGIRRDITRLEGLLTSANTARDALEQLIQPAESVDALVTSINTAPVSPEIQAAIDFVSSIDAGGTALSSRRVNKIAQDIGLEVDRSATPEVTIQRLRDAIARDRGVATTSGSTQAIEQAVTLAMRTPERLTPEQASELAENTDNALTDDQREFLRAFTEARIAENALVDLGGVSADIFLGRQTKNRNKGIKQFRDRIGKALASRNQQKVDEELAGLASFERSHRTKAEAVAKAFELEGTTQVHAREDGTFFIPNADEVFTGTREEIAAQLSKNGGLAIHRNSGRIVDSIATEAETITKTLAELTAARAIQFPTDTTNEEVNVSETPTTESQSNIPPIETAPETATTTGEDTTGEVDVPTSETIQEITEEIDEETPETKQTQQKEKTEEEAVPTIGLNVLVEKSPDGTPYNKRNLLADFFIQEPNKEGDSTQRPLVVSPDFLTDLSANKALEFLDINKLSPEQKEALRVFKSAAVRWQPIIQKNLVLKDNPDFYFQDLMQFLVSETDGIIDVEENVKTAIAYAAFNWIISTAARPRLNGPDEINSILGRSEDHTVTAEELNIFGSIGSLQSTVINSMGMPAVQALGMQATSNAPINLAPQLESAIGSHVFKLLHDIGIVERNLVSGEVMDNIRGITGTDRRPNTQHAFIKLKHDVNTDKLHSAAEQILTVNRGTQGVLDKLFSVDTSLKVPSHDPIPYTQKGIKKQGIPSIAKPILKDQNSTPSFLDTDMWKFSSIVSNDTLKEIAGFKDTTGLHAANIPGVEANNNSIQRSIDNLNLFVSEMFTDGKPDLSKPIYFSHVMQVTQRVRIETGLVNPQNDKYHRFLLGRQGWETTITADNLDSFLLRVGEGLGVKTDKQSNATSLSDTAAKIDQVLPAVNALVRMLQDPEVTSMSSKDQQTVLEAVKLGGEKTHSLASLMALAQYEIAKQTEGPLSFKTRLMGEVDGVNNGVMLAHLLLGAADSPKDLFSLLNRGGFFEEGNEQQQYNLWREAAEHFDLYENTADHMNVLSRAFVNQGITDKFGKVIIKGNTVKAAMNAIYSFTGELVDTDGEVTKAARNIIKEPVISIAFGSSVFTAVENMSNNFIDSIYAGIEDTAAGRENSLSREALIDNINTMLAIGSAPSISRNLSIDALMGIGNPVFTPEQIKGLQRAFQNTLGEAVKQTMERDFAPLIAQRQEVNIAAQLTHEIYDSVETSLRDDFINEQMDAGNIPFRIVKGEREPLHALTNPQINTIQNKIKDIAPFVHTYMSTQGDKITDGVYMSKRDQRLSDKAFAKNKSNFGTGVKGTSVFSKKAKRNIEQQSISVSSNETISTSPGVRTVPVLTHSSEVASLLGSLSKDLEQLNIFDAVGAGVDGVQPAAGSINKSLWNVLLNYSPATEVYNSMTRSIKGYSNLIEAGTMPPAALDKLVLALEGIASKNEEGATFGPGMLLQLVQNMKSTAFKADDIKLDTMSQMTSVDQYALEGGNYNVTETDRAAAVAKRTELTKEVDGETIKAINIIEDALSEQLKKKDIEFKPANEEDPAVKPVKKSPFGDLGVSTVASDPELVEIFEKRPETNAKSVIALLTKKFTEDNTLPSREFNLQLLRALAKAVDPDLPINYVTAQTREQDIIGQPVRNARGWFTSYGTESAIYIMSPEFIGSGLKAELLLHELTHAAVTAQVRGGSAKAKPHVDSLKKLLVQVQDFVRDKEEFSLFNNVINSKDPDANLDELIAWGMTNQDFQQKVLAKIDAGTKAKPRTALQEFINRITGLLFGSFFKRPSINSGMASLVQDVTNLVALASQEKSQVNNPITLAMEAQREKANRTNTFSTIRVFNALRNVNGDSTLDPAFQDQLRELLTGIVAKVHGPYGALKDSFRKDEANNPLAVWLKALDTGKAPFASQVLASGFSGNNQEEFVIEQIEVTVRSVLEDNASSTTEVFRELSKLYNETQKRLKPSDFLGGAFNTNTIEEAQALYDFAFKIERSNGKRSDYLSRFVALGLAHQGFNTLLKTPTEITTKPEITSFADRLQNILERVLEFLQNKITKTYAGQPADEKLTILLEQLVSIEGKRRHTLKRKIAGDKSFLDPIEKETKKAVDKGLRNILKTLKSPRIRKSSNTFVRAAGGVARTVAGKQFDTFAQSMLEFRDSQFEGQLGIVAGLINNIKGPIEAFNVLLRARKQSERQQVAESTRKAKLILQAFSNEGQDLNQETKEAITKVFLRTGAHSLTNHFTLSEIENLLNNPKALDTEIKKFSDKLDEFGKLKNTFIADANALGYVKATGINRVLELKQNAHQIARQFGEVKSRGLNATQTKRAEESITPLITLYALKYTGGDKLALAKTVMKQENSRPKQEGNGFEFLFELGKFLEAESQAKLFKSNPALMVHGFTPEIYNPRTLLVTANEQEGQDLLDLGYTKGAAVPIDPADPNQEIKHIYRLGDGGLAPHLTGVIGYGSKKAKGSKFTSGFASVNNLHGINNSRSVAQVNTHRINRAARIAKLDPNRDLSKENGNFMAPVFNESGKTVSWRYLMSEKAKDSLLERNNSFEKVLGSLAGSIQGKSATIEDNKIAVAAMRDQFETEFATRGKSYIEVGPKSDDPELRGIWAKLPDETKQDVRDIWGREAIMVRKDSVDIIFGFRKLSAADPFKRSVEERKRLKAAGLPAALSDLESVNAFQKVLIGIVEGLLTQTARARGMTPEESERFAKRAAILVARGENIWQGVVTEIKDIIVVKSGIVLAGNIFANFTLLHLQGVPINEMITQTLVAFKGATAHRADSVELDKLRTELATGYTQGQEEQIKRRILILEDALARNPVHTLIAEAGLMPTIVEDIDMSEDIYSFKSALARKVDKVAERVPSPVVNVARTLYMTRDGKMYQGLAHLTQMSDFVARYALYQHQTTRKDNPLSHEEAVQRASDAFVNYDIPLHRGLQYSDDMGFTLFTKYFVYIQRELVRVSREQPARVFLMVLLNQFINLGPIVLDSSVVDRIGNNPLRPGALAFPEVLDDLATVSTTMAVIK